MAATGNFTLRIKYDAPYTGNTAGTLGDSVERTYDPNWGIGTGASQFDLAVSGGGVLNSGRPSVTLTLSALDGPAGVPIALARLREFVLINTADPAVAGNAITLVAGATHGLTGLFGPGPVTIPAGSCYAHTAANAAGIVVAAGSADQLTFSSAGTAGFILEIKGASA